MNNDNLNLNQAIDKFVFLTLQHFTSYYAENNNKTLKHCTMPILEGNKKVICDKIIQNVDDFFCSLHIDKQNDIKNQPSIVEEKNIKLPTKIGDNKYVMSIGNIRYIISYNKVIGSLKDKKLVSLTEEDKKKLDEIGYKY